MLLRRSGRPGVLVATYEKQFRFLHLSFQEYLAACERSSPRDRGRAGCRVAACFPDGLPSTCARRQPIMGQRPAPGVDDLLFQGRTADMGATVPVLRAVPEDRPAAGPSLALQVAERPAC